MINIMKPLYFFSILVLFTASGCVANRNTVLETNPFTTAHLQYFKADPNTVPVKLDSLIDVHPYSSPGYLFRSLHRTRQIVSLLSSSEVDTLQSFESFRVLNSLLPGQYRNTNASLIDSLLADLSFLLQLQVHDEEAQAWYEPAVYNMLGQIVLTGGLLAQKGSSKNLEKYQKSVLLFFLSKRLHQQAYKLADDLEAQADEDEKSKPLLMEKQLAAESVVASNAAIINTLSILYAPGGYFKKREADESYARPVDELFWKLTEDSYLILEGQSPLSDKKGQYFPNPFEVVRLTYFRDFELLRSQNLLGADPEPAREAMLASAVYNMMIQILLGQPLRVPREGEEYFRRLEPDEPEAGKVGR